MIDNQYFTEVSGTLYVRFAGFRAAGWSEDGIKKANFRNGAHWQMINDPADSRRPLVQYDTLRPAHKEKLNRHFAPDVPTWCAKAPILALVALNAEAQQYYIDYRMPDGRSLPAEKVLQYTAAANWLTMLAKYGADTRFVRRELGISSKEVFWQYCVDIIKAEGIKLPHNVRKLLDKVKQYSAEPTPARYQRLIHGNHGNANPLKVADAAAQQQLMELIAHPNNYDDVLVAMLYNTWAQAGGYEAISAATVGVWRRKKYMEATLGRHGNAALNERYIRQVKGQRPSAPLYLVEADDYNHNLDYTDEQLKQAEGRHYQRYISYVITDSYNDLVLGRCYRRCTAPNVDMVRLAWIDALYYVRDLVGDGHWYAPWEVKADGFAKDTLHPWLGSIAHFVPAGHGNKHRGYIEPFFGSPHLQRAEKLAAHHEGNYNGHNITAKNRGVNMEALDRRKGHRPQVGTEAVAQIERFYHLLRHLPAFTRANAHGITKEQQWLQAFAALPDADKRRLSDEQMLLLFGLRHQPATGPIAITNRGVEPQIDGVKYSFDITNYNQYAHWVGTPVTVVYDPYDMSRVLLLNEDKGLRLHATNAAPHRQPRALRDATPGSRAALNALLADKRHLVAGLGNQHSTTAGISDPEALLLAHTMPKALAGQLHSLLHLPPEAPAAPDADIEFDMNNAL